VLEAVVASSSCIHSCRAATCLQARVVTRLDVQATTATGTDHQPVYACWFCGCCLSSLSCCCVTGTLAAGINMPARTTVISSLARRTDEGIQLLPHNELLQMAGRAGRRGYDTQGHCVVVQGRWVWALMSTLVNDPVFFKPIWLTQASCPTVHITHLFQVWRGRGCALHHTCCITPCLIACAPDTPAASQV
jgi:hypothetical protein